jgi:hypothetical protein
MRFAQQSNDFVNPNPKNTNYNQPLEDSEMLRQIGLSNGSVLVNNVRTFNFETGEFL